MRSLLNFFYGALAVFVVYFLASANMAFALAITCGTIITCTLSILDAIKDSK